MLSTVRVNLESLLTLRQKPSLDKTLLNLTLDTKLPSAGYLQQSHARLMRAK